MVVCGGDEDAGGTHLHTNDNMFVNSDTVPTNKICCRAPLAYVPCVSRTRALSLDSFVQSNLLKDISPTP